MTVVNRQIGAAVLDVAYGIQALPENDPFVNLAEKTMDIVSKEGLPGRWLVDTVPMLKHIPAWMPGATFHSVAEEAKEHLRATADVPFDLVKQAMV